MPGERIWCVSKIQSTRLIFQKGLEYRLVRGSTRLQISWEEISILNIMLNALENVKATAVGSTYYLLQ